MLFLSKEMKESVKNEIVLHPPILMLGTPTSSLWFYRSSIALAALETVQPIPLGDGH